MIKISKKKLEELYWKRGMSTRKIASLLNTNQHMAIRIMDNCGIKRRDRIDAVIKGCKKFDKKPFSGNIREKSYMLGLTSADFRVRRHGYQIDVAVGTTHPALTSVFKNLFKGYAPIRKYPIFNKITKCHGWRMEAQLHHTFDFLLDKKNVPEWVLNNREAFLHFLAGYVDGEGIISISKNSEKCVSFIFAISSEDKEILCSIFKELKKLNAKPSLRILKKAGDNNLFFGKELVYKKDKYMVRLKRKSDVLNLLKILPLRHSEKIRKRELMFTLKDKCYIKDVMGHWLKLKKEIKSEVNRYVSEAAELSRLNSSNKADALP